MKLHVAWMLLLLAYWGMGQQLQCPTSYQLVRKIGVDAQSGPTHIGLGNTSTSEDNSTGGYAGTRGSGADATGNTGSQGAEMGKDNIIFQGRLGLRQLMFSSQPANQSGLKPAQLTPEQLNTFPKGLKSEQKISLKVSYNNKRGADENVTIYTYLKEVERIVDSRITLDSLSYQMYYLDGGKQLVEEGGVSTTVLKVENWAKGFGCVRMSEFASLSIQPEEKTQIVPNTTQEKKSETKTESIPAGSALQNRSKDIATVITTKQELSSKTEDTKSIPFSFSNNIYPSSSQLEPAKAVSKPLGTTGAQLTAPVASSSTAYNPYSSIQIPTSYYTKPSTTVPYPKYESPVKARQVSISSIWTPFYLPAVPSSVYQPSDYIYRPERKIQPWSPSRNQYFSPTPAPYLIGGER